MQHDQLTLELHGQVLPAQALPILPHEGSRASLGGSLQLGIEVPKQLWQRSFRSLELRLRARHALQEKNLNLNNYLVRIRSIKQSESSCFNRT